MDLTTNRRDFAAAAALLGAGAMSLRSGPAQGAQPGATVLAQAPAPGQGGGGPVPLAPPDRQPPNLKVPTATRKAGWAIVGLGELALDEIMPAFGQARLSKPTALVSGHADKARRVAEVYGVSEKAIYDYAGYDRIKDNAEIDIVYIVLPNSMHAEYTIRALEAGKHVLCEKPMAVTVAESERMIAAAKAANRKLMIAYRLHYEPLNRKVMEFCRKGELGNLRTFTSSNCQDVKAPNIRLSAELGGGPVGDIGVYSINAARYCFGEEPVEVFAAEHRPKDDPRFREVPQSVVITLRFPSGGLAHLDCSFAASVSRSYRIHGDKGYLSMDPAFAYRGLKLMHKRGDDQQGTASVAELAIPQVNQFAAEMDHFSDCVLNGKDPTTPGAEGLADMRILEAVAESARTGRAVRIGG